jgi:spore maturation protein SpmB
VILKSISELFWLISILYFLELSGSGGVGLLVRCKRVFGVDAFDIRKYRSNILSLITKIDNLEKENRKLKNEVDALEQYGRRSLIRISGIPEPTEEGDTTEKVILYFLELSGSGGVGLLVRCKRVFGVDAFDIRKYRSNILSTESSKMKSMLWSSMDAAALLEFPGFRNRRKKVTLPKKFAKSYLILTHILDFVSGFSRTLKF